MKKLTLLIVALLALFLVDTAVGCQQTISSKEAIEHYESGKVLCQEGNDEGAISEFTKAIELDAKFFRAYGERGISHTNLGQYDKAIIDFDKAIEVNPNYAIAYQNRALAYRSLSEYSKAIADFDKAIELDPKTAMYYCNRGLAYANIGERGKAIADLNKAIELSKDPALTQSAQRALQSLGQ